MKSVCETLDTSVCVCVCVRQCVSVCSECLACLSIEFHSKLLELGAEFMTESMYKFRYIKVHHKFRYLDINFVISNVCLTVIGISEKQ